MIYNVGGCPGTHAPHAAQQQPLAAHPLCGPAVVAIVMVVVMMTVMMLCMAPVVVLCTPTCSRMCSSMQRRAGPGLPPAAFQGFLCHPAALLWPRVAHAHVDRMRIAWLG